MDSISTEYKWSPEDLHTCSVHIWLTTYAGRLTVEIWDGSGKLVREWDMGEDYYPVQMGKLGDMIRENREKNPVEAIQSWMRLYMKA